MGPLLERPEGRYFFAICVTKYFVRGIISYDGGVMNTIHDAISQIKDIRNRIIETQLFKGYSGRARFLGGVIALYGAVIMNSRLVPRDVEAHIVGWGLVALASGTINFAALMAWFVKTPENENDPRRLRPVVDAIPPLIVAAALTHVMIINGTEQYLFGLWMCLFGLVNLSSRHVMPKSIWALGIYYIACGVGCLLLKIPFLNPIPMGVVFFLGETWGGAILFKNRFPDARLQDFFLINNKDGLL